MLIINFLMVKTLDKVRPGEIKKHLKKIKAVHHRANKYKNLQAEGKVIK